MSHQAMDVVEVDLAENAPLLFRFDGNTSSDPDRASVGLGLAGLGVLLFCLSVAIPLGIELVEDVFSGRPAFWVMGGVAMLVIFPAGSVGSFSIAAAMFWHVPLVIRYAVAIALFVPSVVGFTISLAMVETVDWADIVPSVAVLFSSVFVCAATVGILAQLCTPWTLAHLRTTSEQLPRLGIQTLIQLTTIVAITFAFVSVLKSEVPIEATLAFGGVSALGAVMGIVACVAYLRDAPVGRKGVIASCVTAFAMSFAFVACLATVEFGWQSVVYQAHVTLPLSLFGAAIIGAFTSACVYWLRQCGWRCVR
ncbi:hypothetical protein K239x_32170 [Planctomycetes bacterium K23_9]|uniref:Uncharacterized protein n=2 Tax=Stieleria marina TaxID=1930275 RepID=A0A517NVS2_9BACT|nr:hypothetical protein K239x_32170 [Planctomycetes bacterium K23_9]